MTVPQRQREKVTFAGDWREGGHLRYFIWNGKYIKVKFDKAEKKVAYIRMYLKSD